MKIVMVGGHFSPAQAVIEVMSKKDKVILIGRKYSMEGDNAISFEYETSKSLDLEFFSITTAKLNRRLSLLNLFFIVKLLMGVWQSYLILRRTKPNVLISFGSYVSIPVVLSAFVLKIPIIVHEQTQDAGFANKIASHFAQKICISFESSRKFFPANKTILTGNPIRKAILKPNSSDFIFPSFHEAVIYVTGGSQGSHFINSLIFENLEKILNNFTLIHQTGDSRKFKDYEKGVSLRQNLKFKERYLVSKFFSVKQVGAIFSKASLVVSRSGINIVNELIVLNKPALLIPIEVGQRNEQLKNALLFKKVGLGEVLEEKNLTPEIFYTKLIEMFGNLQGYKNKIGFEVNNSSELILKIAHNVARKN